jgi:hypothetical protein
LVDAVTVVEDGQALVDRFVVCAARRSPERQCGAYEPEQSEQNRYLKYLHLTLPRSDGRRLAGARL